ncbi:MAG: AI-2E family transporter [Chloroflexi bacterium]|nr:AI-2E family transporter [Chloroflexota bacterium]
MDSRWSPTTKLVVLIILLVFGAWLLMQLSAVIPPLLVAGILAFLLKPLVDWIVHRTGWSRGFASAFTIFLALVLLLVLTPLILTPGLANIITNIDLDASELEPLLERLRASVITVGPLQIEGSDLASQIGQGVQALAAPFATGAIQIVSGVATGLLWAIFIIVVIFWLLKDSYKLYRWAFEFVPASHRKEVIMLGKEIGLIWGGFFRGELVLALIVGALVTISMMLLGIPNALLLGLIAGVAEFVPTIGPPLASLPALLTAYFMGSGWWPFEPLTLTLIVAIVYIIIFQIEQVYLLPRIVGRRVRLHPGVVFVGAIVGAIQLGVLGVLIAAPAIATARLLGGYVYRKLVDLDPFPELDAEKRRRWLPHQPLGPQPVRAIFFDLDGTLVDTDDMMVERIAQFLRPLRRLFPDRDPRHFIRHALILAEGPINWLLAHLDRLDLDDELFRFNDWARKALGLREPEKMILISGVDETLHQLKPHYKLALVTTRSAGAVQRFLTDHGFEDLFDAVITASDVRRLKPHPEPILAAAEQVGVKPEECVMVGDTTVDVRAAHAAGARAVGVLCGFGEKRDLQDAELVIENPMLLLAYLPQE